MITEPESGYSRLLTFCKRFFVFLLFLLMKSISFMKETKLEFLSDNIGDLASPTRLAGLDWSVVINRSNYYGYGFKWIYAIFFKLTDNPAAIYYCIVFTQALFMALAATMFYFFVAEKYPDRTQSSIVLLILAFGICSVSINTDSEPSLFFFFLFLNLVLQKAIYCDDKKRRILWSMALPFFLCYMITLHERSLAVILAFGIVFVFDLIYARKSFLFLPVCIPSFVFFYVAQDKLTDHIRHILWPMKYASGSLKNTTVAISKPFWFLQSIRNFIIFLKVLFSNTLTGINKSYGFLFIALMLVLFCFICFIFKNRQFKAFYMENRALMFSFLVCVLTVMIIIAGVAQRWGIGILNGGKREPGYYYKGMTYVRYYRAFLTPACVFSYVIYNKIKNRIPLWYKLSCLFGLGVSYLYFYFRLYPVMQSNREDSFKRFGFSFTEKLSQSGNVLMTIGLVVIGVSLLLFAVGFVKYILISFYMLWLIFAIGIKDIEKPSFSSCFDNVADVVTVIEDKFSLPKDSIYLYKYYPYSKYSEHSLQFMLPKYTVQYGWPQSGENALVVSAPHLEELKENSPTDGSVPYIPVDEVFCIYVYGEDFAKALSEAGINVVNRIGYNMGD